MPFNNSHTNPDEKSSQTFPIVVIGRQFGCGGREIGRLIAKRLNAGYYDKTLLSKTAQSLGFDISIFDSAEEKRPSWLRSLLSYSYGTESAGIEGLDIDNEGLYKLQSQVIRKLADEGPCVFVGRTADYILRDYPNMLSIFLHAPVDVRCSNIVKRNDSDSETHAASMARKMDNARQSFYSYYTNRKWGEAATYHLSFDTSRFTPEQIAETVSAYFARKLQSK